MLFLSNTKADTLYTELEIWTNSSKVEKIIDIFPYVSNSGFS